VRVDIPALMNMMADSVLKDPRETEVVGKKKRKIDEDSMFSLFACLFLVCL
jgi:hypothetical protein